jgi:3-oxoacyl-[acyl-carrier protein] reductase
VEFLLSPRSDGITGKLISAVWDPWEKLDQFKNDLNSDIYTLRRIVPKDRGKTWGDK